MEFLKRLGVIVVGAALLSVFGHSSAQAQTKEVRGQATAVSDSSLTVKAGEQTLSFVVDGGTLVEAKGASTRSRRDKAAGNERPQIKVTDYVKPGTPVLVSYREVNGQNRAITVRPVASAGDASPAQSTKNAQGKVKAISGDKLTIDEGGHDLTFAIDRETDVLARGASRTTQKAGGRAPITDFVHTGDLVRVGYRDLNGSLKATEIQIRGAATIPKK